MLKRMSSGTNPAQIQVSKEDQIILKDFLLDAAQFYNNNARAAHNTLDRRAELQTAADKARNFADFFSALSEGKK